MLRVLSNQRMENAEPGINTSNSSDHSNDLPAPPSSRNVNPAPPSNRNVKMKVPLHRTSSQQQRLRPKTMAISTISEDAPLKEVSPPNRRKNGVRRTRSSSEKDKVGSTNRKGSSKERKGVHWNHRVEKKRHHRLQDLTSEEREAVWYTENDTKIILAMAKVTVKMMMRGEACDDVDYCSRGLEGKTPAGSKQRQKNKLRVRKALIAEQEMQREEGVHDPEYLAQVSIKNSKDVCIQAHKVAVQDEEEIREYVSSVVNQLDHTPVQPRRGKW